MNDGPATSAVHLTVLDTLAVLLHASLAVNVLVLDLLHPSEATAPSDEVMVTLPHASVALAVPSEPSGLAGLQPSVTSLYPPVNEGGAWSTIHVTVLDIVELPPHASFAVNVLVWERPHPLLLTAPSLEVIVSAAHASLAVAEPSDPLGLAGLQPRSMFA